MPSANNGCATLACLVCKSKCNVVVSSSFRLLCKGTLPTPSLTSNSRTQHSCNLNSLSTSNIHRLDPTNVARVSKKRGIRRTGPPCVGKLNGNCRCLHSISNVVRVISGSERVCGCTCCGSVPNQTVEALGLVIGQMGISDGGVTRM
eukprot:2849477-Rhodomonas_salina.1